MNILQMYEILNNYQKEYNDALIGRIWGMDASVYSRKKKEGSKIKDKNLCCNCIDLYFNPCNCS